MGLRHVGFPTLGSLSTSGAGATPPEKEVTVYPHPTPSGCCNQISFSWGRLLGFLYCTQRNCLTSFPVKLIVLGSEHTAWTPHFHFISCMSLPPNVKPLVFYLVCLSELLPEDSAPPHTHSHGNPIYPCFSLVPVLGTQLLGQTAYF